MKSGVQIPHSLPFLFKIWSKKVKIPFLLFILYEEEIWKQKFVPNVELKNLLKISIEEIRLKGQGVQNVKNVIITKLKKDMEKIKI